jgi:hypothetical protein
MNNKKKTVDAKVMEVKKFQFMTYDEMEKIHEVSAEIEQIFLREKFSYQETSFTLSRLIGHLESRGSEYLKNVSYEDLLF